VGYSARDRDHAAVLADLDPEIHRLPLRRLSHPGGDLTYAIARGRNSSETVDRSARYLAIAL
jgi:hypothetical protein